MVLLHALFKKSQKTPADEPGVGAQKQAAAGGRSEGRVVAEALLPWDPIRSAKARYGWRSQGLCGWVGSYFLGAAEGGS